MEHRSFTEPHAPDKSSELQETIRELEMVFQSSHDEIFVTDAQGICIRVNPSCERHYGLEGIKLLGRNVYEMEAEKIFYPSATVMVLREERPVTLIQSTSTGRHLHVTANPVFDESGKLIRVVSNSLDITEILTLKQQIEQMEKVIEEYNGQLELLRKDAGKNSPLVAKNKRMVKAMELLERVSQVDTSVLLLGESGVGKSKLAHWLHTISSRQQGPFVEVNCGAIPASLFESELFGYEPGSFSGASSTGKIGLLEAADTGTLFLDEIAELPLEHQTKLLQVIQNKHVMRIGGRKPIPVDVRFVTATNRNLEQMVEEGTFRKDLYYRLNVVPVSIPSLAERPEDVLEMIFLFMQRLNAKYGFNKTLSHSTIESLLAYSWPGNVRELENVLERLAVTSEGSVIYAEQLYEILNTGQRRSDGDDPKTDYLKSMLSDPHRTLKDMLSMFEQDILSLYMKELRSTRKVAKRLGVSQSTISRKLQVTQK
ncbi:sigma-54 interaction domain-containing protein [Brevibacillus sp. TJ4]|uniref:sigma-54 interaction domain-containing protein n=1 Tax=Brevibacillus sp. TJ4 TaxID=3234853 RepID=UPI0037D060E0